MPSSKKSKSRRSSEEGLVQTRVVSPQETKQVCEKVIALLMEHDLAWPFNQPVDPVALDIPMYFQIIKNPMDLGTVRHKLAQDQYEFLHQVLADVRLVWHNCLTFNDAKSDVAKMAKELSKTFEILVKENLSGLVSDPDVMDSSGGLLIESAIVSEKKETVVSVTTPAPPASNSAISDEAVNDGICGICETEGNLLLCDGPCLRSFHLSCVGLENMPEEDKWFCRDCDLKVVSRVSLSWSIDLGSMNVLYAKKKDWMILKFTSARIQDVGDSFTWIVFSHMLLSRKSQSFLESASLFVLITHARHVGNKLQFLSCLNVFDVQMHITRSIALDLNLYLFKKQRIHTSFAAIIDM
jgi:hypothetical protein